MAARIFAVLSAALIVLAIALAVLAPRGLTLGQGLVMMDHRVMSVIQGALSRSAWLWTQVVMPLLVRPAWLLPVEIGIVCGGAALTLSWLRVPDQSRRRS